MSTVRLRKVTAACTYVSQYVILACFSEPLLFADSICSLCNYVLLNMIPSYNHPSQPNRVILRFPCQGSNYLSIHHSYHLLLWNVCASITELPNATIKLSRVFTLASPSLRKFLTPSFYVLKFLIIFRIKLKNHL